MLEIYGTVRLAQLVCLILEQESRLNPTGHFDYESLRKFLELIHHICHILVSQNFILDHVHAWF